MVAFPQAADAPARKTSIVSDKSPGNDKAMISGGVGSVCLEGFMANAET